MGWSVFLSKDGKTLQGTNLGTKTDSLFGIAPQLIVPTGLGTGKVDIIMFTEVNGLESKSSDTLVVNYMDNYVESQIQFYVYLNSGLKIHYNNNIYFSDIYFNKKN